MALQMEVKKEDYLEFQNKLFEYEFLSSKIWVEIYFSNFCCFLKSDFYFNLLSSNILVVIFFSAFEIKKKDYKLKFVTSNFGIRILLLKFENTISKFNFLNLNSKIQKNLFLFFCNFCN